MSRGQASIYPTPKPKPLSEPMRELLARIPDEWGDFPRYNVGTLNALRRRDLIVVTISGKIRKSSRGKEVANA